LIDIPAARSSGLAGGACVGAGGGCRGITRERSVADANLARGARSIHVSRKVGRVTCDFQNNIAGDEEGFAKTKINIHTFRTIEEDVPLG
jgi:hypothetical protein